MLSSQPKTDEGTPDGRSVKYLSLDVHQTMISIAVLNADGMLVMQSVIATHAASSILDFILGCVGPCTSPLKKERIREEGTHSAWLYDLLVRRVARMTV